MDTDTINDKIDSTLDLVQNCLKEEDVEVYKSTVFRQVAKLSRIIKYLSFNFRYERKIGHVVGWDEIRSETLEIKGKMDALEKEFTDMQNKPCKSIFLVRYKGNCSSLKKVQQKKF